MLCFVVVIIYHKFLVQLCYAFTHILQDYLAGTGAIIDCPSASEPILKGMGKINFDPNLRALIQYKERERLSLSAFLRTGDIGVRIVHISRLIITYTYKDIVLPV